MQFGVIIFMGKAVASANHTICPELRLPLV